MAIADALKRSGTQADIAGEIAGRIHCTGGETARGDSSIGNTITHNIIAHNFSSGTFTIALEAGEHHLITIAPGAEATLIDQSDAAGAAQATILLQENARLKYYSSARSEIRRTLLLERCATADWIDATFGTARNESTAYLLGEQAEVKFRSLFVGREDEEYDIAANMIHAAPHTSSNMLTRAALLGKSKGRYRGLIRIMPGARGCVAYQRQDSLLLGDESSMDSRPVLEIGNDDVRCSHGVTLGQVDAEKLFYMESRGIPPDAAAAMIVNGFFDQIIISMGEYGSVVRSRISDRLQRSGKDGRGALAQQPRQIDVKSDFPLLKRPMAGKPLVYLDSAASTQKPRTVIDAMTRFYETSYANVHRGIYPLAEGATRAYELAREKAARFINAATEETIFTRSTTDGINMIARSLITQLKPGDEVVVTGMEHHSNFVPWQQLCKQHDITLRIINLTPDDRLDMDDARRKITDRTRIVAVAHASNVLGTVNPVQELARMAHEHGAIILVDGAQAVAHMPVDVKALDVDFYAFSGHKMYGPEGIGVLYGKRALLQRLPPSAWGGEMVKDVTVEAAAWNDLPYKFEPGTPDITQAVGLGAAIDYIQSIGWERILAHEHDLLAYALGRLKAVEMLEIVGPKEADARVGAISFVIHGIHAHDIAQILSYEGIAVRAGHHCAKPLHCDKGIMATARASFGIYTTRNDIDKLINGIEKTKEIFR